MKRYFVTVEFLVEAPSGDEAEREVTRAVCGMTGFEGVTAIESEDSREPNNEHEPR